MIPFNKPALTGRETQYILEAIDRMNISGNGLFTQKCQRFFRQRFGFDFVLMTTSCTDALEMSALLLDIGPGDEIIVPSFTFVSTANAFALRGAKVVFADSRPDHPNISAETIEPCITPNTKAVVVVHYAGMACDMDPILELCRTHDLKLIEDAAHAVDSAYKGEPLGRFGDFATFSFHETKNVICGEGGMLAVNNKTYCERAEIIWEKGTNRSAFFRREVSKYEWLDIGSSFLPSELNCAFLLAQLENIDRIQSRRRRIWDFYHRRLTPLEKAGAAQVPHIPPYASNNGHLFYLICESKTQRNNLIAHLANSQVQAVFHYLPLHLSPYYLARHQKLRLKNAEHFSETLLRLPLYFALTDTEMEHVADSVIEFFKTNG